MKAIKRQWIMRFIKIFLLAAVLYFVSKAIANAIANVRWSDLDINPWYLMLSTFSEMAARLCIGLLYWLLLKYLTRPLTLGVVFGVSWVSLLGKYVPGKIAAIGGAVYLFVRFNVRRSIAAIVPVMATIMMVAVALLLAIPLFFSSQAADLAMFANLIVAFLVLTVLMVIRPHFFIKPCNCLLKKMGYPPIESYLNVKQVTGSMSVVIIQFLCTGLSTWCFINVFTPIHFEAIPTIVSMTSLAWAIGLLAVFSPAGLGVKEGVLFLFLSPLIGIEMTALVAVCLRLLQTVIDLLAAGMGGWLLHRWTEATKMAAQNNKLAVTGKAC